MQKLAAFAFSAFLIVAPLGAFAQAPGAPAASAAPIVAPSQPDSYPQAAVAPAPIIVAPAPAAGAIIDTGSYAGAALTWVITIFGGTIGTLLSAWIYKILQAAGLKVTEQAREKLQDIIVNGLNLGAMQASAAMAGRGRIAIKNEAVAQAVVYAQSHGADTLKKLGLDPTSPEAVEAIKARIETAIADPATPTATVLDPPDAAKVAAPAPIPVTDSKLEAAVAAKA